MYFVYIQVACGPSFLLRVAVTYSRFTLCWACLQFLYLTLFFHLVVSYLPVGVICIRLYCNYCFDGLKCLAGYYRGSFLILELAWRTSA